MGTYKSGIPEIAYQVYPSQLSEKDIFKKVLDHNHVVFSYWLAIDLQLERKLCSVRAADKKIDICICEGKNVGIFAFCAWL